MASSPIFVVAANKIERAREELQRLYNGLEDVMGDLARAIDDHVPHGPKSHQDLLDQMHVALENR